MFERLKKQKKFNFVWFFLQLVFIGGLLYANRYFGEQFEILNSFDFYIIRFQMF